MSHTSVYLNVDDASRSISFYEALGFKVQERHETDDGIPQYVGLTLGGADLALGEIAANEDPEFQAWVDGTLGRGVLITFVVDDIGPVHEVAQASDAEFDIPYDEGEMGKMFSLIDPDGYNVMFWEEA